MKQINILKRIVLVASAVFALGTQSSAQLSGNYTVGGVSPDYTTLSAAISALNSNGVNGPVTFLIRDGVYSGTSWIGSINNITGASASNRITFRSESGNRANVVISDASSSNYIFRFNNARFISVKDMTLRKTSTSFGRVFDYTSTASNDSVVNCVIEAPASTSSSNGMALVYMSGHTGSDNVFRNNQFINGGMWAYLYGSNTSSTTNNTYFINNTFTATNSGYYGFYMYYTGGTKFLNNTITRTGSGVYYLGYGFYLNNDFAFNDNVVNVSTTSTLYALYFYYMNYVTNSSSLRPEVNDNIINLTQTTGTTYVFYTYYAHHASYLNNVINLTQSSGTVYNYGPLYYNNNSKADGNVLNYNITGSGTISSTYINYNGASWPDTFTNNKLNFTIGTSGSISTYLGYYGNTITTGNEFISNTGSASIYNYLYYPSGMLFANNKIKSVSATSGTIYGIYAYNTTSYSGATIRNNDIEATSGTGTVYGILSYYQSGEKYYNNVVTTKSGGSSYTLQAYYHYNSTFKNNTFCNLSTGSNSYVAYIYMGSSSYKSEIKNNIFSKTAANGFGFWSYDNNYTADYNLYYVPGGTQFYMQSPSYTGASLQSWRTASGKDRNSLVYNPPFVDAANRDFRIVATDPGAWAVNGRAEHDTFINNDLAGTTRTQLRANGVPDIGAYEVTPTSTPPNAVATPANPVANSTQVFTFGQDTVATIDWGATVPATYTMRQYTGVQAAPMPAGVGRMYFYAAGTPATWVHPYKPKVYYKNPWIGNIPGEHEAVIARSSNAGAWEGYNYTNASTDTLRNILAPTNIFDSVGSYTGVQNGRIGIRCVENPKGIAITNITATSADIDWAPVFNPIGYQVIIKQNKKYPTAAEWSNSNFPTTNSLAANGLQEDSVYYVFVRSVCGVGDTSGFSMDSFKMLITCHTPVVKVTDINNNRAVVYWDTIRTATKYDYVFSTSPTPPAVGGTEVYKNNVLISFLDPGKEYYVHVRANCNSIYDKSGWGTVSFKTWPTGVENVSSAGQSLSVYPNPVNEQMVVTVGGTVSETGTLTIMDMTGKQLQTQTVNGNRATVNVNNLPAGMYIAQYADEARREQVKFTKQ